MLRVTKSYYDTDVRRLIAFSYGAMHTILSYLRQIEITELQLISKWFYKIGVARIQMHVQLHTLNLYERIYFLLYNEDSMFEYLPRHKKVIKHAVSGDASFPHGFGYV